MQTRLAFLLGLTVVTGLLCAGCNIENCEEGAICIDDEEGGWCYSTCRTLAECGRITDAQRGACMDACHEAARDDDDELEDYRECVEDNACSTLIKECGQPPFQLAPAPQGNPALDASVAEPDASLAPDAADQQDAGPASWPDASLPDQDAGSDAASDAATSADARADAGELCACQLDTDCPTQQVCRSGFCRAPCAASCECPEGQVCQEGGCVPPPPVSLPCESRCDCPSGDSCVERMCITPTPS